MGRLLIAVTCVAVVIPATAQARPTLQTAFVKLDKQEAEIGRLKAELNDLHRLLKPPGARRLAPAGPLAPDILPKFAKLDMQLEAAFPKETLIPHK